MSPILTSVIHRDGWLRAVLMAMAALLGACPTVAQTSDQTNMTVSATLSQSCSFDGSTVAQFPTIRTNTGTDADWSVIRFRCSEGVALSTSITNGGYALNGQRRMAGPVLNKYLPYNIYTTAARTTPYPTTASTPGTGSTGRIATGDYEEIHFYGRILPQPTLAPAGSYYDSVLVTLTW